MQRTAFILAYFIVYHLIWANLFAQLPGSQEQYPFVHYTPKDGLISNMIKKVYQDSKGRIYFTSINGLSVYDGSRFINYTSKNGLGLDIVNDLMEMGEDSIWIVTNINKINCLMNGKIKEVKLENTPIINSLYKDEKGTIYIAAEEGIFFLDKNRFIRLPFFDTDGTDINSHILYIFSYGDYLLVQRDNSITLDQQTPLYLYNKITKKITAKLPGILGGGMAPDKRIWVSTAKSIMALDTIAIKNGGLVLQELPRHFNKIKDLGKHFLQFDRENNCWLGDALGILTKTDLNGQVTSFTSTSGLSMSYINSIFLDKEGSTWIATNNTGVDKLTNSSFLLLKKPFGLSGVLEISYSESKDRMLLYSPKDSKVVLNEKNKPPKFLHLKKADNVYSFIESPDGLYSMWLSTIIKMGQRGNTLFPERVLTDTVDNIYSHSFVDKNGVLLICGKNYLTAVKDGKIICRSKLNYFADYVVTDSKGNIWLTTRDDEVIMYWPRLDDLSNYLEKKFLFKKEIAGVLPRSITIDRNDNIWVGSRSHGIFVYRLEKDSLIRLFNLNKNTGLSDDFIAHLTCDSNNNIWASSFSGLDRITVRNGNPVIENLTKQNNIYQRVYKVIIDKENTAWALVSNGIIRIAPGKKNVVDYSPSLIVSLVKAGMDTITEATTTKLSYSQNNLTFYFAATSFIDEKQVVYTYRLQGRSNTHWSEPSNIATVSLIDLRPGDYSLEIKANFPASRYPEKFITYQFSIAPPWWATWWFRSISSLAIIALLILAFRFYYRRKLEKKLAASEKQQAIEKERTRIATDMHDDLGAGLSRIKFLSETIGIKKLQQQPIEEDVNKIREYSHEMIDKMGEIVWALNEKNDSLSDLLSYTRAYAVEYLSQNGISCEAEMPDNPPTLFVSGEFRRNIFLTIKEALHNVVKHSQATEVKLSINVDHNLLIKLRDNGVGFDKNNIRSFSNGLTNMETRVKEIGGKIEISNKNGTVINLLVPLKT